MTTITRKQLDRRARQIGLYITGERGAYYLDRIDADYLDRRGEPMPTLGEVEYWLTAAEDRAQMRREEAEGEARLMEEWEAAGGSRADI